MTGDQTAGLIWFAGAAVLVGSGLVARRLPGRQMLGMALAWTGIFAVAFLVAQYFT